MFATVEWVDRKGGYHSDGIKDATCVTKVLSLIEGKGGRVSKYNRIPKVSSNTMTPAITMTPLKEDTMPLLDDIEPVTPRGDLPTLCDVEGCHCRGTGHAWRVSEVAR
jgi:hypothetical protein